MKKTILLFTAIFFVVNSYSTANVELPKLNANQILIPIGKTGKTISLMALSKISMDDLGALKGRKLNFMERLSFRSAQKKLLKNIAEDGSIKNKKIVKFFNKAEGKGGFNALGFILGFFLGLVGVLLAYVINDDEDKKSRVKWAWLGFAIGWVLVLGLYVLLIAGSGL